MIDSRLPRELDTSRRTELSAWGWTRVFDITAALACLIGLVGLVLLAYPVVRPWRDYAWYVPTSLLHLTFAAATARLLVVARPARCWRSLLGSLALCLAYTAALVALTRLLEA
ncbi:hypothetical protein GTW43_36130 [Streptomyces sp. SID5785]|uniref:hypothetical protein n=1 Tax=Streptomyces sp. SID5785 TaxID=2690309 RepID=UPI001360F906|nr:hypothetical protein [Streptomyces sp. SID5785]MZD10466.1 hypothetical protein [Streptomyces sp. SID5785]